MTLGEAIDLHSPTKTTDAAPKPPQPPAPPPLKKPGENSIS
ncbi:hypothetical protein [[Phormidium] sp. ETS-05]|nr:hypothetical protein [[Phormidium] sp. ETS-05]